MHKRPEFPHFTVSPADNKLAPHVHGPQKPQIDCVAFGNLIICNLYNINWNKVLQVILLYYMTPKPYLEEGLMNEFPNWKGDNGSSFLHQDLQAG